MSVPPKSDTTNTQKMFVSRMAIEELARLYAETDLMLETVLKACEHSQVTNTSLNPVSVITYIKTNRPQIIAQPQT
jgi:hypothetical protein